MQYKNIVPEMTSDSQYGFTASFTGSSGGDTGWKAFNGNYMWRSNISPKLPEYITINFPNEYLLARYSLDVTVTNYRIKSWELQGLVDGIWVTLHQGEKEDTSEVLTFDITPASVRAVRLKCNSRYGSNSWMFRQLILYEVIYDKKTLVKTNLGYHGYNQSESWILATATEPSTEDYLQYGIDDLALISEEEWNKLDNIEIFHYTDDPAQQEMNLLLETDPYTLEEHFGESTIEILEYTNDLSTTSSNITIKTDPFPFYDELDSSFDVLYYTDDPEVTNSAELEIVYHHSPLDELGDDIELITWTEAEDKVIQKDAEIQLVESTNDGMIYSITVEENVMKVTED